MDTQSAFGFKELFTCVVGEAAKAVSERGGENKERQRLRSQAAVHMIMAFRPRDVAEAMLAGHCVMFHELMVDSVRETLRGETDTMRRATRSTIIAMDRAFAGNLALLERYRARPSDGRRDGPNAGAADPVAESVAPKGPPVEIQKAASPRPADVPAMPPSESGPALELPLPPGITLDFSPSQQSIAACLANPEAMAALKAGDPAGFARALGIDTPTEDFLTEAASPASVFAQWIPDAKAGGLSGGGPGAGPRAESRYANGAADGRLESVGRETSRDPNRARGD